MGLAAWRVAGEARVRLAARCRPPQPHTPPRPPAAQPRQRGGVRGRQQERQQEPDCAGAPAVGGGRQGGGGTASALVANASPLAAVHPSEPQPPATPPPPLSLQIYKHYFDALPYDSRDVGPWKVVALNSMYGAWQFKFYACLFLGRGATYYVLAAPSTRCTVRGSLELEGPLQLCARALLGLE